MTYESLIVEVRNYIGYIQFNRPDKANALHQAGWTELQSALEFMHQEDDVRVVILSGAGKHFCSGIDLSLLGSIMSKNDATCRAKVQEKLRTKIIALQNTINTIESCCKPVIAAIKGGCIGAGVDIISACDMRYASHDAYFSIREINIGMVADLGTLQRLPTLVPQGIVREMAFTGRNVCAHEAEKIGLVNECFSDAETLFERVNQIAQNIASKSPLAIRGTKHVLNYSRDHSVADGLNYIATWNAAMLLSEDLSESLVAQQQKRTPVYDHFKK
jgi:enoyl-CoA hydratase